MAQAHSYIQRGDKTIWLCACVRAMIWEKHDVVNAFGAICRDAMLCGDDISFLIPIRLKTRICDCLQTGPQRRRGLSRQVRGEWAEWKARRVPRMAPWRLSTLGTSARGTLADRTPPPSRPYVGEIRVWPVCSLSSHVLVQRPPNHSNLEFW